MRRFHTAVLCFLALPIPSVFAQNTAVLRCDRLLDVREGRYIINATVLIQNDKIASVSTGGVAAPTGARVITAPGTCIPGLIDVHVHLTSDPDSYARLGVSVPRETVFDAKNARRT